jgi:hypothetical protein
VASDKSSKAPLSWFIRGLGEVSLELKFRSPVAVFGYLGIWLNATKIQPWNADNYGTDQASDILGSEPFLNIIAGDAGACFVSISYAGTPFCVPAYSRHTAMLFDVLMQLRNLNIQPADLNSAFTVRLSN